MGDVKEIHDVAMAYFRNLSEDQRLEVHRLFIDMDKDGDGALTINEVQEFFGRPSTRLFQVVDKNRINQLFRVVDKNGDGTLEFEESVTLFYCVINDESGSSDQPSTPNYQAYRSTSQTAPRIPKPQVSRSGAQTAGALNAVNTGVRVVNTGVRVMDHVNNGTDFGSTVADIGSTAVDMASLCSIM